MVVPTATLPATGTTPAVVTGTPNTSENFLQFIPSARSRSASSPGSAQPNILLVPGMFNCGDGVGTSTFDAATPLVRWVAA
jgi:hypothetical protein